MIGITDILHSLPGRTRIKLNTELAPAVVEYTFRKLPYIYSANYTAETNSLLLYHPPAISTLKLIRSIKQQFQSKAFLTTNKISLDPNKLRILLGGSAFLLDNLLKQNIAVGYNKLFNLTTITAMTLSTDIFKSGIKSLFKERRANGDTLTASAIIASILKGNPKSALVILIMGSISELITEYTANRTRNHVSHMLSLDIPFLWKVDEDGIETKVPMEDVKKGDIIAVFHGEKIPVDGEVLDGNGTIDESSITGEFLPKGTEKGSEVYAGSILKEGQLKIRVEHAGEDTAVTKMIHLIEEAQSKQAPIQSLAVRVSEQLVPISFLMAGLVYATTRSWDRVLSMLTIDFVCGLKLSTATAFSAAVGKAAKKGIIVKGGQYIERLAQIDTLILDKTGTITEGKPFVTKVRPYNGFSEEDVIYYAASAEEHSSHPIAEAILKRAYELGGNIPEHDHDRIENIVGRGVQAFVNNKPVLVGNLKFMKDSHVNLSNLEYSLDRVDKEENVIYVSYDQLLIGTITIDDKVRLGMGDTIQSLRQHGINEVVMLTGDKKHTARRISNQLSLDSYHAEALPKEKADYVKSYRQKNNIVMMVGDGINDAPALAYADVGVTMGTKRTDIAVEASDVTIMSDDPKNLANVVYLSKETLGIIQQNFMITMLVNSAAILLGAVGVISPITGAGIHNGATIFTVFNSARIVLRG
ncbi:cation-transporting P-type ATPase C [Evansella vedderi]|uniref:Cd(2+)-exporting ATPase n=1 Tax=Evansella vedderi TaxID=38282 RepID=A0ABU0A1C9_9BACI|nr:cation-translocating P-type ATPase [Evansella vedderi]MDQ0257284.1 cation-transporting P-type ATPase C [Evansella vedderi]